MYIFAYLQIYKNKSKFNEFDAWKQKSSDGRISAEGANLLQIYDRT